MNKIFRSILYIGAAIIVVGVILWRFDQIRQEKQGQYATFGNIYETSGKPVHTLKLKSSSLLLFKKLSAIKSDPSTLLAKVGKNDLKLFKVGQGIFLPNENNKIGRIFAIDNKINYEDGLFLVTIKLNDSTKLSNEHNHLIPIRIQYGEIKDILKLPIRALIPTKDAYYVWKVQGEKAQRVTIDIKSYNQEYVEVTSGLNVGDIILTNGHRTLKATEKISVVNK